MSLTTANGRSSAINPASPWRSRLPLPDGTIAAIDRAHSAYMYELASGSSGAAAEITDYIIIHRRRRR